MFYPRTAEGWQVTGLFGSLDVPPGPCEGGL